MAKQKLKTPKTVSKRIKKITANGKILVLTTSAQHLATNKSKRRRRASRNTVVMAKGNVKQYKKLVG
ncbi:50S ribosomal protein L35 [Patescibacteria group bacterium]|nr:50S ribosomal protein L35 [Patescibacteria group bacterium]